MSDERNGRWMTGACSGAYFPMVDAMRGLMAVWVFVLHAAFFVGIGRAPNLVGYLVQHVSNFPAPAVVIFFTISGFVIYLPFARARYEGRPGPALGSYGIRRAVRILPAYWVALAIAGVVLYRPEILSFPKNLVYFGLVQVYDSHTFMRALAQSWTLDVELVFYAAAPLAALLLTRYPSRSRRHFLLSELGLCAALYLASTAWQVVAVHTLNPRGRWFYGAALSFPGSMDMIVCGMAVAAISVACTDLAEGSVRRSLQRAPWAPWVAAASAFYLTGQMPELIHPTHRVLLWLTTKQLRCFIGVAALLPLVFATSGGGMMRTVLRSRISRFFGTICLGFYLWHGPVLLAFAKLGVRDLGAAPFVALSFVASISLGCLSWYLIELPSQRAVRRWLARQAGAAGIDQQLLAPRDVIVATSAPPP